MDQEQLNSLVREQGDFVFDRMYAFMEKVKERLERACNALESAKVDYAVVGGNAVAAWVFAKDEGAICTTQSVDVLLRQDDYETARSALEAAGFVSVQTMGVAMFLDGPEGKPSQAVHILWAGQKVKEHYTSPTPSPNNSTLMAGKRVVDLEELVRMKLNSYRRKD